MEYRRRRRRRAFDGRKHALEKVSAQRKKNPNAFALDFAMRERERKSALVYRRKSEINFEFFEEKKMSTKQERKKTHVFCRRCDSTDNNTSRRRRVQMSTVTFCDAQIETGVGVTFFVSYTTALKRTRTFYRATRARNDAKRPCGCTRRL